MGKPIEKVSIQRLCHWWKEDGGFTTYDGTESKSWNCSHPDVTVVIASLLGEVFQENKKAKERLYQYLSFWFSEYELPPSFWWKSSYYTALEAIPCFYHQNWAYPKEKVKNACLKRPLEEHVVELARHIELLAKLKGDRLVIEIGCKKLLKKQKKDGSFFAKSSLRVTDQECRNPWEEEPNGNKMAGEYSNVYATATVFRCLQQVKKILSIYKEMGNHFGISENNTLE